MEGEGAATTREVAEATTRVEVEAVEVTIRAVAVAEATTRGEVGTTTRAAARAATTEAQWPRSDQTPMRSGEGSLQMVA